MSNSSLSTNYDSTPSLLRSESLGRLVGASLGKVRFRATVQVNA
nr:hypothetical protein [uncultured Methanoregula sp.]